MLLPFVGETRGLLDPLLLDWRQQSAQVWLALRLECI